jgi:hypothetical protein
VTCRPDRAGPALRHQAFEAHVAGGPEQVGADLALLEGRDKDAVRPPREQADVGLGVLTAKEMRAARAS